MANVLNFLIDQAKNKEKERLAQERLRVLISDNLDALETRYQNGETISPAETGRAIALDLQATREARDRMPKVSDSYDTAKTMINITSQALQTGREIFFRNARYTNYASGNGQQQLEADYWDKQITDGMAYLGAGTAIVLGAATMNPLMLAGGIIGAISTSDRITVANKTNQEDINRINIKSAYNAELYGLNITSAYWR